MGIIGTAPNQTFQRSDGTRTGSAVNTQAKAASVKNTAALADYRENEIATALNLMVMKNGGNTASANLPMGGYRHVECDDGVADTDYATVGQLNAAVIPSGTAVVFAQAAAPTGWTQVTTSNDTVLRLVNSTGGGTGGTVAFSTVFASKTPTGTVGSHTLTSAEMPTHSHGVTDPGHAHLYSLRSGAIGYGEGSPSVCTTTSSNANTSSATTGISIQNAGSGGGHDHTWTGAAMNFDVTYKNVIICTKD